MKNVPPKTNQNSVFVGYICFKMSTVLVSALAIWLGYRLFVLGVTGQVSLSIDSKSVSGQLLNAAPGLVFAVCGIVALIFSVAKGLQITFQDEAALGASASKKTSGSGIGRAAGSSGGLSTLSVAQSEEELPKSKLERLSDGRFGKP
jgi:hypothetical protein